MGKIGETFQGETDQKRCAHSSPTTRNLHCPLLTSSDSGRKMGRRAQGGCGHTEVGSGAGGTGTGQEGSLLPRAVPISKNLMAPIPL